MAVAVSVRLQYAISILIVTHASIHLNATTKILANAVLFTPQENVLPSQAAANMVKMAIGLICICHSTSQCDYDARTKKLCQRYEAPPSRVHHGS